MPPQVALKPTCDRIQALVSAAAIVSTTAKTAQQSFLGHNMAGQVRNFVKRVVHSDRISYYLE